MTAEPQIIKWANNRPLCSCSTQSAFCLGKKHPDELCMAHDNWYRPPCDDGKCPGPGPGTGCCHKPSPDACFEDDEHPGRG